jgi:hypothetical protein
MQLIKQNCSDGSLTSVVPVGSMTTAHLGLTEAMTILLRGIQLTHIQRYCCSTVKMVVSFKIFTFHETNTCARTFLVLSQQ